jgi:hypothetical protein
MTFNLLAALPTEPWLLGSLKMSSRAAWPFSYNQRRVGEAQGEATALGWPPGLADRTAVIQLTPHA